MTPLSIGLLFHCGTSPEAHPHINVEVFRHAINDLMHDGLVCDANIGDDVYVTTEKGAAHIAQLCNLAYPVTAWVCADGEPINLDY